MAKDCAAWRKAGWVVTSVTFSLPIYTVRPSRIDSRYSAPVLSMACPPFPGGESRARWCHMPPDATDLWRPPHAGVHRRKREHSGRLDSAQLDPRDAAVWFIASCELP